ncbi:MAG: spermidine synthase [Betaproteobacteria bacterium]
MSLDSRQAGGGMVPLRPFRRRPDAKAEGSHAFEPECATLQTATTLTMPCPTILELPNPFAGERGTLRVLEPADCDRRQLVERILSGTYDKPYVIDEDDSRSLYFSRELTQSGMRLSDPCALDFAYTRKMMSFLLFVPQPAHILMLGLGGGSLAKYCHRHLPATRVTVVEIDPHILAFREQFLVPPDDARFCIRLGDAADYLRHDPETAEVVMIDAFDRHGFSASVCTRRFYLDVRDALSAQGVMVANMVGPRGDRTAHLDTVADVFGGNIILLPVASDDNYLVFAFRDASFEPRWRWIEGQARAMQKRFGLDFPAFAASLKLSRKDGYRQRSLHLAGDW